MTGPLVIGHRGASGHRPEHTALAYQLAWRSGADSVEPDVVCSRDGILVCRHDLDLALTTDVADRPEFAHKRRTTEIDGGAGQQLVRPGLLPRGAQGAARPRAVAQETSRQCDVRRAAARDHPRGAARPPRGGVGARRSSARRAHRAQDSFVLHRHEDAAARVARRDPARASPRLTPGAGQRDVLRVRDPQAAPQGPRRGAGPAARQPRDRPPAAPATARCLCLRRRAEQAPRVPAGCRGPHRRARPRCAGRIRCGARRPRVDAAQREPAPAGQPARRRSGAGARRRCRRGQPTARPRVSTR